ncbi:MAG TPA: S-adenosylmethionine:tRNA ribosyltransferase-isomerase, partial [Candidatus Acidoferrales bacterium]|nr:S-adenosylmethionine:tRNA ribosyltransferase-isomerase [Candidatus Acidoferrales bacterium]
MLVSDFNYHLREELIAQEPLADRAGSRLLRLDSSTGATSDLFFRDFPGLLRPNDLLVFNNTRVFPARLYGRRGGLRSQKVSPRNPAARDFLRGQIEVLLTRQVQEEPNEWECLVRPGRKIGVGEHLFFGQQDELQAEVIGRGEFGERRIRFEEPSNFARPGGRGRPPLHEFFAVIERIGHVPLPPYIAREDSARDRERYQTVYARER